ncbi:MAG: hypothetical protein ACLTYN_03755 [Dysosmobacter welbionis]
MRGERTWDEKHPLDYLLFASAGGVEAFSPAAMWRRDRVRMHRAGDGPGAGVWPSDFSDGGEISAEGLVQAILRHHAGGEQAEGTYQRTGAEVSGQGLQIKRRST